MGAQNHGNVDGVEDGIETSPEGRGCVVLLCHVVDCAEWLYSAEAGLPLKPVTVSDATRALPPRHHDVGGAV